MRVPQCGPHIRGERPLRRLRLAGGGSRAGGLEAVLGLCLPAAQLVLRPRVLQLQLPLLGLQQERDRRRAEGRATRPPSLAPSADSGVRGPPRGKQRRLLGSQLGLSRMQTRTLVLRLRPGTLTCKYTRGSSTLASERTCSCPRSLTGQVGQTPAGHPLVTSQCGHTRLCVWDLRNPHRDGVGSARILPPLWWPHRQAPHCILGMQPPPQNRAPGPHPRASWGACSFPRERGVGGLAV